MQSTDDNSRLILSKRSICRAVVKLGGFVQKPTDAIGRHLQFTCQILPHILNMASYWHLEEKIRNRPWPQALRLDKLLTRLTRYSHEADQDIKNECQEEQARRCLNWQDVVSPRAQGTTQTNR